MMLFIAIKGLSSDDVIYCHLPLYHSSGGQIATGSAVMYGTKTFIKKKFSASAFWKDCVTYNITVRYLKIFQGMLEYLLVLNIFLLLDFRLK